MDILYEAPKIDKVLVLLGATILLCVVALEETNWIDKQSILEVNMEPFNATRTSMGDD